MQMALATDFNAFQLGMSVKVGSSPCMCARRSCVCCHTNLMYYFVQRSSCTMLLCMLQILLNRAKAEPATDISVIFSSGALDRLAAVLQVVLSSQACCSAADRLAYQTSDVAHCVICQ